MNIYTRNNDNDFLKYLDSDEMKILEEIAEVRTVEKGTVVFNAGDKDCDIYYIKSGALSTFKLSSNGEAVIFQTLHRGEISGEINLTFNKRKFGLAAKYTSEVTVYPYKKVKKIINEHKQIAAKLMAAVNDSLTIKNIQLTQKLH